MYIVAPLFKSPTKNCPGHVYFPLTRGNSRLLCAVTLGNGHLRSAMRGYARCLVGPGSDHNLVMNIAVV